MSDQYDDGYHHGYIDGQHRISYETDELNHTLNEYILVAESLDDLYVRECKKTKELTKQLDLMKGWEKIAQSNGEDKRKYLEERDVLQKQLDLLQMRFRVLINGGALHESFLKVLEITHD
jgi:hypothetical protein